MAAIQPPPVPVADGQPSPLTRYPLQDINTPCQTDGFYVELVSREDSSYQRFNPIARGTPYATVPGADSRIVAQYSGNPLYFLKQTADIDSMRVMFNSQYDNFVLWIWGTDTLSQDTYNSEVVYVDESSSTPQYTRVSEIRRKTFEATPFLTYKSALTALLSVAITAAGTGYGALDANGVPVPTLGTVGNALAMGVVDANGAIIDWVVVVEGSGIASAAALVITGSGTGATATTRIQPASAVLVSQKKQELPESDPKSHDYVRVVRVYQTLPGAVLTEYDQDDETQVNVVTTYQIVAAPVSSPTQTNGILISYRKIDSQKSLKIVRDFTAFLSFSFDEQKFGADTFPALLDFSTYSFTDACGAFSQLRSQFSAKTQIRTHVSYTATKQTYAGLQLLPKSLMLGRGFQINQSVLVDDYTFTYVGTCTGTVSGFGSTPNYSTYVGSILGTEQLVAGESVLWKAGIYRNTQVFEIML